MRQIFLDTETTGLEHRLGHRIIEIGCVEMCDRHLTHRHFQHYLNPERDIDAGALEVHGISIDFLQDKPRFAEIAEELLDFVRGAELIIHNAPFDIGFLNAELARMDRPPIETVCRNVLDVLLIAKDLHPGKKNNLNALCERYRIDNSKRTLHGALLDAELLADVYAAMTRGQGNLEMEIDRGQNIHETSTEFLSWESFASGQRVILKASAQEVAEHKRLLAEIQKESKGKCLWLAAELENA